MPVHTVSSISDQIFQSFPYLTSGQKDDILALLEEFEKMYGVDFFDGQMTVQNAVRLTGLKYIAARDVLMSLTAEVLHDILALHPLLETQDKVFKKLEVIAKVYEIADLTAENKFQICDLKPIGEMIQVNPKLIYYFMD